MKRLLAALTILALITPRYVAAQQRPSFQTDTPPSALSGSCADLDPTLGALRALAVDLGGNNWQPFVLPVATMSDPSLRAMWPDDWRTYSRISQDYGDGLRAIEPPPVAA